MTKERTEQKTSENRDGVFTTRRVATSGCEIRDPDGNVVASAADSPWALLIASLLNWLEAEGLLSSMLQGSTSYERC